MKNIISSLLAWKAVVLLGASIFSGANAAQTALSQQPLVSRSAVPPNVLFALSVEHPTGNTAAYQDVAGYSADNEYLGYFDAEKCYTYDGDNEWYTPLSMSPTRTCGSEAWSGNFLNWSTMAGLDAFRMAMTGGNRYRDFGDTGVAATRYLTVLERANLTGQTAFTTKNMTSTETDTRLNLATPLLGETGLGNIVVFNNGLQSRMRITRPSLNVVNSLSFAQVPNTRVANVKIVFKNYLPDTQTDLAFKVKIPAGISTANITVNTTYNYNIFTGEMTFPGWTNTLTTGATRSVTITYRAPSYMSLTKVEAFMYRSGSIWGEITMEKEMFVRSRVCVRATGLDLESNCQRYGAASYKPVGVIQKNGQDMRFGMFSYYNLDDHDNAVMRARLKTTSPRIPITGDYIPNPRKEWLEEDGTFILNPDADVPSHTAFTESGVINYINKFGRVRYKSNDPVGRLYYEALSYLRNRPADVAFYTNATTANAENFPVVPAHAWDDPQLASCQANYLVVMGDVNTHCDKRLPGGRFAGSAGRCANDFGSLNNGDALDVWQWTNTIGVAEARPSWPNTSLTGSNDASTYMSGIALYARTSDMRPDDPAKPATTGKQSVKTFIINVEENGGKGEYSQFWYAAKYGGFDDVNGNTMPTTVSSWSVADASYPSGRRPKTMFPASNPKAMIEGVEGAIQAIAADSGAASAAATSSPNVTQTNNFIYSSTYRTIYWDGEVTAQRIDYATGNILPGTVWQASQTVNSQADALASGNTTARKLYTLDTTATGVDKKKGFLYANLTTLERDWFTDKCSNVSPEPLQQCTDGSLTSTDKTNANLGPNMVNFLRGYNTHLKIYRNNRTTRLGDIVNAAPVYVGAPAFSFSAPTGGETYATFKTRVAARPGTVYVASNDGFIHAFKGTDGVELFAYTPRQVLPELYKLADKGYAVDHRYYVDGTPVSMDIYDTTANKWRTIIVGGLNAGGSGYYALDITDPTAPLALWEVCSDALRCPNGHISTMGKSYGNPVITRMPPSHPQAGKWVVLLSSGYNNATGLGYLYVLDAVTGELLDTYTNGSGAADSPSGLSKISTFSPNFSFDGVSKLAYAGDLNGDLWRFDLSMPGSNPNATKKVVQLKDAADNPQPITSKMEVGTAPGHSTWPVIFVGTGRYLSKSDFADVNPQSIYAIKDPFSSGASDTYTSSRGTGWVSQQVVDRTVGAASVRSINNPQSVNWTTKKGWHIDLPDTGERVALDLQLNLGTLLVASNVVTDDVVAACQVGGYSWLYQLNYATGSYVPTAQNAQAATKFSNALLVGNTVTRIPSGALKVVSTTAKGEKVVVGYNTGGAGGGAKKISWREVFK